MKKRARLNCIGHPLTQVPFREVERAPILLPERQHSDSYERKEIPDEMVVPEVF